MTKNYETKKNVFKKKFRVKYDDFENVFFFVCVFIFLNMTKRNLILQNVYIDHCRWLPEK